LGGIIAGGTVVLAAAKGSLGNPRGAFTSLSNDARISDIQIQTLAGAQSAKDYLELKPLQVGNTIHADYRGWKPRARFQQCQIFQE
jgi:hypothetical protein